jgi:uncharacterized membrane protein YgcG
MRFSPILPLVLATSLALAACDHHTDSIARLNRIPFGGANDANIAAMAERPADLMRGRGQGPVDGTTAEGPIHRLLTDRPKPLLNAGSNVPGGGGGNNGSGGGGGGGGGGASGG